MLTIISHDAGGAEILSSWLLQHKEQYHLIVAGPAKTIFEEKIGEIEKISFEDAISQSDWILTGTSWQSNLEFEAIKMSRKLGKKTVVFLDHWVNYKNRFIREGCFILPDEIWVGDKDAYSIAKKEFPTTKVLLKDNPYFEDIKNKYARLCNHKKNINHKTNILYVCTPFKEYALVEYGDELYWGYTEEDAFRYFINNINLLKCNECQIILRPHPSEHNEKYNWVLSEFNMDIMIGGTRTLLEEIYDADIIVGCDSMAMVVGLLVGKRVVSGLPPGKRSCCLPMREIEHMHLLANTA